MQNEAGYYAGDPARKPIPDPPDVSVDELPSLGRAMGPHGETLSYNKYVEGPTVLQQEQAKQAVRDAWGPNSGGPGRGMSAAIGAVGLYSVMSEFDAPGAGLEDACIEFFRTCKEIHQAAAREEIYGPGPGGQSLNDKSIEAIKALNAAISNAGLDNSTDRDYEASMKDGIMLFNQEISTAPGSNDARDFIMEFMKVTQDRDFTQNVEEQLEKMGKQARVDALLYRDRATVPENYGHDVATQEGLEGLAYDL